MDFVPNKVGTNKKADYNWQRGSDGQDTDKAVRVLLLGGGAHYGSSAGSDFFYSNWFGQVLLLMSASLLQLNLIK